MTDRSTPEPDPTSEPNGAAQPDPDAGRAPDEGRSLEDDRAPYDGPTEPSKYELDASSGSDVPPSAPALDTVDPAAAPIKPKMSAVVMLGMLAVIMAAFGFIGLQQNAQTIYDGYNPAQIQAMAKLLADADVRSYTDDEIAAVKEIWATEDHPSPSDQELADAFNQGTNASGDDVITAEDVNKVLEDAGGSLDLPSRESIESSLRTQVLIYFGVFVFAAVSAYFYFRGKSWARATGMFVSGVVAIMWGMQAMQSGFIPLLVIIAAIGAVTFYLLLKGRLEPVGSGTGGFGQFWAPKPRPRRGDDTSAS